MMERLPDFEPNQPPEADLPPKQDFEYSKNRRLEKLFQPITRPEAIVNQAADDYSFLLAPDDQDYQEGLRRHIDLAKPKEATEKAQRQYDRLVNPDTKQAAANYLMDALSVDRKLAEVIGQSMGEEDLSAESIVDALREDSETRYATAVYLLDKLDRLVEAYPDDVPDRIVSNGRKNPDARSLPVDDLSSREYVTYLALAKLDGSFNDNLQQAGDGVVYHPATGKVIQAQHRFAADFLLSN